METRSTRASQLTDTIVEHSESPVSSAPPSHVSVTFRREPTEIILYVMMPPQKPRTFPAEANFLVESFTMDVRIAWKAVFFNDAEKL